MEGELQRTLGRNLRKIRHSRGFTIESLAEQLRVSPGYIGEVERGERNLSLRSVERLAGDLDQEPLSFLTCTLATYKSVDQ